MKSLQSTGTSTTARTAARSACEPPNRRRSVSTLMTRAPPAAYWTASSAGSGIAARSPLDGLRRFTSAITPTPGARSAARALRAGRASRAAAFTSASGRWASRTARSSRTPATISSSTVMSDRPRAPLPVARPSPRQPDGWTHSRCALPGPLSGGSVSDPHGFRYAGAGPAGSWVGSSPRSRAFQAAWARSSSVSGRRAAAGARSYRRPIAGHVRPRRTASSPAPIPSSPPTTARAGHTGVRSTITRPPARPIPGRSAEASEIPPASARSPDQASRPPAAAMSSPTTARPGPRTASSATAAASSTSPAAGTSGAASAPLRTPLTGGSGASRSAVTRAQAWPPAIRASAPAPTEPRTAAPSSLRVVSAMRLDRQLAVEAGALAGVAGRALLVDEHQQRVAVAVHPHAAHPLAVARRLPLHPVLAPAARPVGGAAGGQGPVQRLVVHPGEHQHLTGVVLLDHRGHQAGGVAAQQLGDDGVEGRDRGHGPSLPHRGQGPVGLPNQRRPGPTTTMARPTSGAAANTIANAAKPAPGPSPGMSLPSWIRRTTQ